LTSSEKLARAGRLLKESKALTDDARVKLALARELDLEVKALLAEVRGEIVLEGDGA
jgi:hypothetical protein